MRLAYYATLGRPTWPQIRPTGSLEVPEPPAERVRRRHHPGGDLAEDVRRKPEGRAGYADGGYHVAVGVADRGGHRVEPDLVLPFSGGPAAHADVGQFRAEHPGVGDRRDRVALQRLRQHG